jgi:hypothetical protein
MRLSIEPIGPEHRDSLQALLAPFGLPPEIVEWKYFRRTFGGKSPAGFVWLKQGSVRGTIGLIPFELSTPAGRVRAAWTCDWVVDSPASNPGVGVMLLQHAGKVAGPLLTLGGTEVSQQLTRRLAARWFPGVSIELHVPLRAGGGTWFRAIDRRLGGNLGYLAGVPLHTAKRSPQVVVEPGVSGALEQLLGWHSAHDVVPVYDLNYVRWQIEQCPVVESVTCYPSSVEPCAFAVAWRRKDWDDWRLALWAREESDPQTRMTLEGIIEYVFRRGARRLSTVVSRLETDRLATLRAYWFRQSGAERSLYLTASMAETDREPTVLSFLDTDLAYRF